MIFVRQVQGVEAVDQLRAVGHGHLFRVAVEHIQIHRGKDRVAQRGRLFKEIPGRGFRTAAIPRPPFVDNQFDAVRGIGFAHDAPVVFDERFHALAFAQQLVPVHGSNRKASPLLSSQPAILPRPRFAA